MESFAQKGALPVIDGSRRPVSRRGAFTLIELLVVVTIILILVGITLKITSIVGRQGGKARTLWVLEQVKNSLGAYYTANGTYPPVNSVTYVLPFKEPIGAVPDGGLGYSTGLVYYIYSANDYQYHNPDPEVARWAHYLKDIGSIDLKAMTNKSVNSGAWVFWTNKVHWIADGWGNNINYSSSPPYQQYKLWSSGPNGSNEFGAGDDIGVTWSE